MVKAIGHAMNHALIQRFIRPLSRPVLTAVITRVIKVAIKSDINRAFRNRMIIIDVKPFDLGGCYRLPVSTLRGIQPYPVWV